MSNALPWYYDQAEVQTKSTVQPTSLTRAATVIKQTPKSIYQFLDARIWGQHEAKKAAALFAYNSLVRNIRQTAMFVGPTGSGKTYIFKCLAKLFSEQIIIEDASNITQDGWKGERKWADLLCSPSVLNGKPCIVVIDEADKMLAPKTTSTGENVGRSIAAEGLKILEGSKIKVKSGSTTYLVDTGKVSFALCGAFFAKASQIAETESCKRIGFGETRQVVKKAYARDITEADLIDYGVLPEFLGRINRLVNLQPMTVEDYFRMLDTACGPLQRLSEQYGVEIRLSAEKRRELAEYAFSSGLGIRAVENRVRQMLDDAVFDNYKQQSFEF